MALSEDLQGHARLAHGKILLDVFKAMLMGHGFCQNQNPWDPIFGVGAPILGFTSVGIGMFTGGTGFVTHVQLCGGFPSGFPDTFRSHRLTEQKGAGVVSYLRSGGGRFRGANDPGFINSRLIRGVSRFSGDSDHFWREHPPNNGRGLMNPH